MSSMHFPSVSLESTLGFCLKHRMNVKAESGFRGHLVQVHLTDGESKAQKEKVIFMVKHGV